MPTKMPTRPIFEWSIFTDNVSEIKIMLAVFVLTFILFITYYINNKRIIDLLYGDQLTSTHIARFIISAHVIFIIYFACRLYELT